MLLHTYIQQVFHHNDKKADLKQQPYIQHIKTVHIYTANQKKKNYLFFPNDVTLEPTNIIIMYTYIQPPNQSWQQQQKMQPKLSSGFSPSHVHWFALNLRAIGTAGGYLKFWVTLTVCLLSRFIADWSHTFCIYNYVTAHTYCFECGTNFIDWQLQTYISGDLIIELVKGTGKVKEMIYCLFILKVINL